MAEARRHICLGFTEERYPEGTHICYLYNSDEERRRILPLFARHALLENEAFGYLADVETHAELPAAAAALDLTHALMGPADQVQLLTTREGYYPEGQFDSEGMLARLRAQYLQARAAGLAGARFAGEMDWALRGVPGTEHIIECESRINDLVKEAPITIMCQYDLRKFDGAMMFDVMNVHPVMIVGGHILRNPFYKQA
ncbi:MEDS domain-containing protein [Massilia sp. Mn16-1_5]|uniref:MEDS domain-containing protein n=1 Tax=Massilia sp. Mn16-1_5 TaxID=2079199 RepID=UPI0014475E99|nr:MEDS domain-containing protein [Massilia sp. Mn16-1_5]